MQKTAKKFLSMLLALMMVLSILPTAVFATEQGTVAAPLDSIVPYGTDVHNQPKIHIEIRLKTHIFPRTFADLLPLCYDNITRF